MEVRANIIYNKILQIIYLDLKKDTTYTQDLKQCAKKYLSTFKGVYASDEIPILKDSECAIINTDDSKGIGEHWTAIYRCGGDVYLYDSFGRNHVQILPSLIKSNNGVVYDAEYDAEQIETENNCGQRCIAWLILCTEWGIEYGMLI